jgi:O-antigen/teichoic acid export membrane protein
VKPSIHLFLAQLIVAAGGWIYWLVISKFTTSAEIGYATTTYSLVLIMTTIIQLGLEYPLLKESHNSKYRILGTALAIELAITLSTLPVVFYVLGNIYHETFLDFAWLATGLIVLSSIGFVSRFVLLGVSDAKTILIYEIIGTSAKFIAGYFFVIMGLGAIGILLSFFLGISLTAIGSFVSSTRSFTLMSWDGGFAKRIIKDALVNTPSKLSRIFVLSLSIMLLAAFGVNSSDTGIFYIAVMISIAVGGLASSLAFMSIPATSTTNTDFSGASLRLGLGLTAPVISMLLVVPQHILSIIGDEYVAASTILFVLTMGILPSILVANTISKLNNSGRHKELLIIGAVQMSSFFVAFFTLVPKFGTLGAAYSILAAFSISAIPSLIWLQMHRKYAICSIISVMAGSSVGFLAGSVMNLHPLFAVISSVLVSLILVFKLRITSFGEIKRAVRVITEQKGD